MQFVRSLSVVTALGLVACGSNQSPEVNASTDALTLHKDKDPQPQPQPQPPQPPIRPCTGFASTSHDCRTTADWKLYAYETCAASGQVLTDYKVAGACEKPDTWQSVSATCCSADPPPPPPPPPHCSGFTTGVSPETPCRSEAELKQLAFETCAAQRLVLTSYTPQNACRGGFLSVSGTCCAADPPPPPNPCVKGSFAGGVALPLKDAASAACSALHLSLTKFDSQTPDTAEYACCPTR